MAKPGIGVEMPVVVFPKIIVARPMKKRLRPQVASIVSTRRP